MQLRLALNREAVGCRHLLLLCSPVTSMCYGEPLLHPPVLQMAMTSVRAFHTA
jgi:hypothetical protein